VLSKEILENHERYLERKEIYRNFGFDMDRERKIVLEKAGPIVGDILEIGTGKGYFTILLAQEGYRFVSVDISGEEQKTARLNLEYFKLENFVDFKVGNAEHLSFKDNSFGTIFSINTAHHFMNPFKVLDELLRVMSCSGKLVISDFSKEGLDIIDKVHSSEGRIHETSRFSLKDIEAYLKRKGFHTEKHTGIFQEIITARGPLI